MGRNRDRDAVRAQADAQARIAATQENLATRYNAREDEDRARQQALFGLIQPLATSLLAERGGGPVRPDLTPQIRRDYATELGDIQGDVNRSVAGSEDYFTSAGLGRSGFRGAGFGAAMRGGDAARTVARQNMQGRLAEESLNKYADERSRRAEDINLQLQGANLISGQQGVFDPNRAAVLGQNALSSSVGSRTAASGGFRTASQMPSGWSRVASLGAGLLGTAVNAWNPIRAAGGFLRARPQPAYAPN